MVNLTTTWRKVANIAHRGAGSISPENTLVAARKAYQTGADMWELDVQLTGDLELVVIHDDTLTRTTDVEEVFPNRASYRVDDFTLPEIKQLDAGSWFVDEDPFGEVKRGNVTREDIDDFRGQEVPTLKEALELTESLDWEVDVEIKPVEGPAITMEKRLETLADAVVSLIRQLDMEDRVIVSSFDHAVVELVKELNPSISGGLLVKEPVPEPIEVLQATGAEYYMIAGSALTEKEGMRNLGRLNETEMEYTALVWTVNETEDLRKLVTRQLVGGVITDYPQRLSTLLEALG